MSRSSAPYTITGLNPYPWIRWWYALAAPPTPPNVMELPLAEREFLRRGKLTSIALLIELSELLLTFGPATHDGTKTSASMILVSIGVIIVAVFLNRARKRLLAGLLVLMIMEAGMVSLVAAPPSGQLGVTQIPFIFLLVQPLMISVLVFPAWGILALAAINMFVTALLLFVVPKTHEMQLAMQTQFVPIFVIPLAVMFICALISFIVITSLQESLERADKAEEVTKLQQVMAEQTRRELQTKRQLEEGVQEIISALTLFSNGNNRARIRLETGHPLWPIAGNVNNMISRFVRMREQEWPMEETLRAIQTYLMTIRSARVSGTPTHFPRTGTAVDILIDETLRYSADIQQSHSGPPPLQ
jgi:hypothetical protein